MRRLVAAGLLPERAGQPVKVWAHISLADLLLLDGSSALQQQWTAQVRARWAARRAHAAQTGANDGAWLDGDAAAAIACDAAMAPIVTGDINVDALEDLVRLCVELDTRRRDGTRDAARAAVEQAVIGKRRHDVRKGLCLALSVPPPSRHSSLGLDPGRQPGRDDDGVEQEQDQGAAQPRTTRPRRVTAPVEGRNMRG